MTLSPIVLFVYKRLWHTQQTIEALRKNELAGQSDLYIYSDYPKGGKVKDQVAEVRKYIRTINGFKKIQIIERDRHFGLADSVISGVTDIIKRYDKVIVLEDDLVSTSDFLEYMNNTLNFYKNDKRIFSITGYTYPINIPKEYSDDLYLYYRCCSWGWGTWIDRWNKADWEVKNYQQFKNDQETRKRFNRGGDDLSTLLDFQMRGKIDSWAIRWCYTLFKNTAYCLYPVTSKIRNIGQDGSGTHFTLSRIRTKLYKSRKKLTLNKNIQINGEIIESLNRYFRYNLWRKIINVIKDIYYFFSFRSNNAL